MSQSSPESLPGSQPVPDAFPEDLRELRDRLTVELDDELAAHPFLAEDLYHQTLRNSVNDPDAIRAYADKMEELKGGRE